MDVYVFMNADGAFLCKKASKIYVSDTDLDKVLTYRTLGSAEVMERDTQYWDYRDININTYVITKIKLEHTRL